MVRVEIEIPEEIFKDAKENKYYLPLSRYETVWKAISEGVELTNNGKTDKKEK